MPKQKSFQCFNLIKKSMPQPQNIFKLFLLAVFCLALFGGAGEAAAAVTIINPDKTLSINGKKTFPQIFYSICDGTHISGAQCVTSLQRMSIFDADMVGYAKITNPEHEQVGMGYLNMVSSGTGNKDKPNFFGYMQVDEPIATNKDILALEQAYGDIKTDDPNHVVIAVDWTRLNELRNMADIIADDGYTYIDKQWLYDIGYTRQTALYFKESLVYNPGNPGSALNGVNDFDGISKPVYAVIQALSADDNANVQPVTKSELRGLIFLAITMNMKGLFYYTYNEQTDDLSVHYGLVRDQTLVQQYIDQAAEIKSLNDILVLPTKDYRWQHRQGTQVSFSKALTASGSIYIDGYTNFNYMLKQDGSVYYLIVLNKDTRSISDVVITVSGLNGPMTAKKIIGSSTTANQDAPVNNGVFTDSFDGLAVHVYQIYSGVNPPPFPVPVPPTPPTPDTQDPTVTIDCPNGTNLTYDSPLTTISGTATDNVGVKEVWVKVGTGGTPQPAVLASPNAASTGWSISGNPNYLTGVGLGANTIYVKSVDTSGNDSIPAGSVESPVLINVTISAGATPPPAVVCTKTVGLGEAFTTIQAAADVAQAGDVVCVKAGTYNKQVIPQNSGNAGNWITFAADPNAARDSVIIDGTGISLGINEGLVMINNKSYIKFTGFKVQYSSGAGIAVGDQSAVRWSNITIENNHTYSTAGGGIIAYGPGGDFIMNKNEVEKASYSPNTRWPSEQVSLQGNINGFIFSNNEVHHNGQNYTDNWRGGEGPTFKEGVSNGKVFGNHIHHMKRTADDANGNPTGQTTGIYIDGFAMGVTNIDVYNNRVHDITGFGISVNSELSGTNESTTVRNNLVYNNSRWGIFIGHGGEEVSTAFIKNTKIINNTIYNNGERGICVTRDETLAIGVIIRNNISVNNGQSQFDIRNADAIIEYNLAFGPVGCEGANCITADPQFVNPAAFDFRLQSTSPAIDAGISTNAPLFDFAGNKRPVPIGGAFDIGAYEYCVGAECVLDPNAGSSGNPPPTCTAPATTPPTTTPPPPPVVCGDSIDGLCPDGCTYLEDIDCPSPPPPPDTTPPTIPKKLTATGSITVPAIDLMWRASLDDRGVAGYNIYKDGKKIATANRLSYTDTDVVFGETHIYAVTAFDEAPNESEKSDPATAMSAPLNAEFMKSVSASDFPQIIGNFLKWILTVAGSLAMLIIIIGGVMYISSSGDEQRVILSKKIVLGAIGGLILILTAYSIVTLLGRIV